jgi:CopG antitoxin of type II toxin-antitoxin system
MPTSTITDDGFEVVERVEDIPRFESEADEAAYWSTHSPSEEMMDQAEPIPDDELPPPRKATYPVSLRLDNDILHRLRVLAAQKHTRYQTLLKTFVIERLYEEEQREGLVHAPQTGSRTTSSPADRVERLKTSERSRRPPHPGKSGEPIDLPPIVRKPPRKLL